MVVFYDSSVEVIVVILFAPSLVGRGKGEKLRAAAPGATDRSVARYEDEDLSRF